MFNFFGKSSEELAQEAALEQESLNRRMRNEARMDAIKDSMGTTWVLHPAHKKSRLETPRPV